MQLKDATVLVADDETAVLEIFQMWFEREGCRVLTAENGAVALKIATANHVDILVSDVRMPVMNGLELAKHVKVARGQATRVVFMTGFSELSDREIFDRGIEATLSKPTRRQELMAVMRRCLMSRDEVWRVRPDAMPSKALRVDFEGLQAAVRDGAIAFGNGGFAVKSMPVAPVGETIDLHLRFQADDRVLVGQGIVRWSAPMEVQIGIEITHVEDEARAWVVDIVTRSEAVPFIPRSCVATTRAGEPSVQ